ncbi:LysR family transcriptional regulator [Yoonia sp.]|uniref:LysR family transcriptional regulator n=1 Tax=Yoonia sp. TaxID=2212373 RepID=UPI001A03CF50|nr:LysR family transcriptional regulator [Yoonia sp.]
MDKTPKKLARDLDWNLLRTFVVVADAGSITRAAEVLGLQQPGVSSALKRLEGQLGWQLIDRKPARCQLTMAGRLLYDEAVDIHASEAWIHCLKRYFCLNDVAAGGMKVSRAQVARQAGHLAPLLFVQAARGAAAAVFPRPAAQ